MTVRGWRKMSEKKLAEKTLENSIVEVHVKLYEPFYNFLKEYLAFFGSKRPIEDVLRDMIYTEVKCLYAELGGFIKGEHVEDGAWFNKWPHIAIASSPDDEEET